MPTPSEIDQWMSIIDGAAVAANVNTRRLMDAWDAHGRDVNPPDLVAAALVNIAMQLAYANTLASGRMYLEFIADADLPPKEE